MNPIEYNSKNAAMSLMIRRMGDLRWKPIDPRYWKRPHEEVDPEICGLKNDSVRLAANGGIFQQDRMIFDKRRSLDRALLYSYQAANIIKVPDENFEHHFEEFRPKPVRALINPDKNKQDYDDKILSVHHEDCFHPGDIFEWLGTHTYWLIYLQDLTEIAYFRGEIRRCQYQIKWQDEDGIHKTFAAVRGPVETKIDFIQKHQISVDEPNHSLHILMPRNEATLKYFRRYSKFFLSGTDKGSPEIVWRVEATDWISTPGILEVTAVEYYMNIEEDDAENDLVGGLIVDPIDPNTEEQNEEIVGETFIKPKRTYEYTYNGNGQPQWSVDKKSPAILDFRDNVARIKWDSNYSGQFVLKCGKAEKTIVVETLF